MKNESVSVIRGVLTYLRSWDTIVDNAIRDAQTKEALQQIVDTGVTGEACTAAHRSAPHDRCWGYKVQMSLTAVTPLATELRKLDTQNGDSVVPYKQDGTTDNMWQQIGDNYRPSRQELDNVSDMLAQNIGEGTVTEHTRACGAVLFDMVLSINTVARLERSTHGVTGTTSTDRYESSPSKLDRARSQMVLARLDETLQIMRTDSSVPQETVELLNCNMTETIRECYKQEIKITKAQKIKIKGSIDLQWDSILVQLLSGGLTNAEIRNIVSHHYSVLQHKAMETKVNQVINLAQKVLDLELR